MTHNNLNSSSESHTKPRLWSDFDGTAVEKLPLLHPRNASKYPLAGIPGYLDFLRGAEAEGVDISGIVTARPNNFQRRYVTALSIKRLGYGDYFNIDNTIHAGSHEGKAERLVQESAEAAVGIIEDLPARVVPLLIGKMLSSQVARRKPITLGIVNATYKVDYLEGVLTAFDRNEYFDIRQEDGLYIAEGDNFNLRLTALEPYSEASGRDFAQKMAG